MAISARYIIIKIDQKQMKQELERRSTLENRNWSDRSSRSTTTTPLSMGYSEVNTKLPCSKFIFFQSNKLIVTKVL